ncbi:MAG TPA: DUF4360 domain-containing protein [Polyangiaceae bacterium]|jgi:hypothetical protein
MHSVARFSALSAIAGIAALLSPLATAEAATPDPNSIYIASVTLGGTGCAAGTVQTNYVVDTSDPAHPSATIQFTYDDFVALLTGPGLDSHGNLLPLTADEVKARTKNCNVAVTLHIPQGITVAQIGAQYNGYAQVDDGVTGTQTTQYYFADPLGPVHYDTESSNFPADLDENGNYQRNDEFIEGALVWTKCGANAIANVNSRLTLKNAPTATKAEKAFSTGYASLDTQSFGAQQLFRFTWATCP